MSERPGPHHSMPFGAEPAAEGGVRFRLWAPDAGRVELRLEDGAEPVHLPMKREAEGWHALVTERAGDGSAYRYRIDGEHVVPDPASRCQPEGVHEASRVVDSRRYRRGDLDWTGRSWEEAVVYELHAGTFTPGGSFASAAERLDHLADLGVTAIEVMPLAAFPGERNWGYDGVAPFAPYAGYGTPDDFRAFVEAAHARGLMVLLDVVYNHFGPEGNYLHLYAKDFFTDRHQTPWGQAINFDGRGSRHVRDFFVHNALYWLEEYRLDGLRLDAVHAIADESETHVVEELADTVRDRLGGERHIHLVLENERNTAAWLEPRGRDGAPRYRAQWNDDYHHAAHVLLTGETDGYYLDYADRPEAHLARCLAEGFAYQGEPSPYRDGERRGEDSTDLPPAAMIDFLQNHDQVGNRAFGERLTALADTAQLRAAVSVTLLAPATPGLFMGDEFGCLQPFQFFADFQAGLAEAVRDGRRREFARFERFGDPQAREKIPDPSDPETFARCVLDWDALELPAHREWLDLHRRLLTLRHEFVVPARRGARALESRILGARAMHLRWRLGDGSDLVLLANLGDEPLTLDDALPAAYCLLFAEPAPEPDPEPERRAERGSEPRSESESESESGSGRELEHEVETRAESGTGARMQGPGRRLEPWSVRWYHRRANGGVDSGAAS